MAAKYSKFNKYFKIINKDSVLKYSGARVIFIIIFIVVLTPDQAMQAALTKNVKMLTTPNISSVKQLPMPPGIKPTNSTVPPKSQAVQKPFLPPPPTPPKLLLQHQLPLKRPPLPAARPPLPAMPPPPPPPSLPPPPPAPNQMLIPQSVTQLPPPPMQPPPPIPPAGFPPGFPGYPYPPLQNPAQSFANSMFSQPPNLISSVPGQYRTHETLAALGVQFRNESVPPRPPYGENYNQRESMSQQQSKPPQTFSEFDLQDSYDENRLKYNESRAFSRDGVFVGGSYGNGSQHYADGGGHHFAESGHHYVDGISQHYADPAYQQFRGNTPIKRGFNNRSNRHPAPPPQYQNRQVRNHPYQRR